MCLCVSVENKREKEKRDVETGPTELEVLKSRVSEWQRHVEEERNDMAKNTPT